MVFHEKILYYPNSHSDKIINFITLLKFEKIESDKYSVVRECFRFFKNNYELKIRICETGFLLSKTDFDKDDDIPDEPFYSGNYNEKEIKKLINFLKLVFKEEFRIITIQKLLNE